MIWKDPLNELPPIGERVLGVDQLGKMESMTYTGAGYFAPSHRTCDVQFWTVMDDEFMQGWKLCDGSHEPLMHTILVRDHYGQIRTDFVRKGKKKLRRFAECGLEPKDSGLEWREMPDRPKSKYKKPIDLDGKMKEV